MNRFLKAKGSLRIAAVVDFLYPASGREPTYCELEAVAHNLDAEIQFFHDALPSPHTLNSLERRRLGGGFMIPWPPCQEAPHADALHWQQLASDDSRALTNTIANLVGPKDSSDFTQAAYTYCRYMQAWAPDLLIIRGGHNRFPFGLAATRLLGIPLVYWKDSPPQPDAAHIDPLLEEAASLVLISSSSDPDTAPPPPSEKHHHLRTQSQAIADATHRIAALAARARHTQMKPLGPEAAFAPIIKRRHTPNQSARPFLIVGAERTGSNLLVDLLSSQNRFACAGELFNPRAIQSGELAWPERLPFDDSGLNSLRHSNPSALHDRLISESTTAHCDWAGYKLLYHHGASHNDVMRDLASLNGLHIIHLTRRDRLSRWASQCKANMTDAWYTAKGMTTHNAPLALDAKRVAMDFSEMELMEDRFRATFRHCAVLELDYNDIANAMPATCRRLEQFFDTPVQFKAPASEKTGCHTMREAISNFDSIQAAFTDTRWQHLFL